MNAITISIFAMILTAALALVAPVKHAAVYEQIVAMQAVR